MMSEKKIVDRKYLYVGFKADTWTLHYEYSQKHDAVNCNRLVIGIGLGEGPPLMLFVWPYHYEIWQGQCAWKLRTLGLLCSRYS
jgi:hypothetical protein